MKATGCRSETIARFKGFLAANAHRPMHVAEMRRLHRAHRALLLGEPSLATVTGCDALWVLGAWPVCGCLSQIVRRNTLSNAAEFRHAPTKQRLLTASSAPP
jgi:hypothetical protein